MSKEFEALNNLFDLVHSQESFEKGQKYYNILEEALTELQAIKNAEPSDAMECLKKLELLTCNFEWYKDNIDTIKQYILKAQEQEKALNELIKNHIEFVVEKDRCYFKIKNSKGNEKSFTSYTMLDFWKEVLKK